MIEDLCLVGAVMYVVLMASVIGRGEARYPFPVDAELWFALPVACMLTVAGGTTGTWGGAVPWLIAAVLAARNLARSYDPDSQLAGTR